MKLPKAITELILDYKASIEHYDKFKHCLVSIRYYWLYRRVCSIYAYFHITQLTFPP
jgi:hypothetical protein